MPSHDYSPTLPDDASAKTKVQHFAEWGYTVAAIDANVPDDRQQIEKEQGRRERHTIARDSRINNGVYEGAYGGEAIVIDYDDDPELIDAAIDAVLQASTTPDGRFDKNRVLDATLSYVLAHMRYDAAAVDNLFEEELGGIRGRKVSLGRYIDDDSGGFGVCRHQALFVGIMLEQMTDRGILGGQVSVERNTVRRGPDGKDDGHSWARYTNSVGNVFILDAAQQQRVLSLEEAMELNRQNPDVNWDYARPEDKQKVMGQQAIHGANIYVQ
jgi:hypothetical protein